MTIIVNFIKDNLVIATRKVDVFYNEYGRDTVESMILKGTIKSPSNYDNHTLTNGPT